MLNTPYSVLTEILPFLYLQASLIALGVLLYRRFRAGRTAKDALLAACLSVLAWVTVVQIGLGFVRQLHLLGLLIAQTAGLAALVFALRKHPREGRRQEPQPATGSSSWSERFLLILFILFLVALFVRLPGAYPFRVDVLAYHLPFVVQWMQTQSLDLPPFLEGCANEGYPAGQELLVHWVMAPLRSDLFALGVNFAALALLGVGMLSLGEKLGVKRRAGALAMLLVVTSPLMEWLSLTLYVELVSVFFLVCAANFGLATTLRRDRLDFFCFCLAFGLAAGVKSTFAAYGAVLLFFLWLRSRNLEREEKAKRPDSRAALLFILVVFAVAGYWYIRNLLRFGNPVHPFSPALVAKALAGRAEGYSLEVSTSVLTHGGSAAVWKLWLHALGWRVGTWIWVVLGVSVLAPLGFLGRRRVARSGVSGDRSNDLALSAVVFLFLLLYLATPWQVRLELSPRSQLGFTAQAIRYGLPWIVFGTLLLARLANRGALRAVPAVCAVAAVVQALSRPLPLGALSVPGQTVFLHRTPILIALAIAAALTFAFRGKRLAALARSRALRVAGAVVCALALVSALSSTNAERRALRRDRRYQKVLLHGSLDHCRAIRTLPPGSRVFFWNCLVPYALYGPRLDKILLDSSRPEVGPRSLETLPWAEVLAQRPEAIFLHPGAEDPAPARRYFPSSLWPQYILLENGEACIIMVRSEAMRN